MIARADLPTGNLVAQVVHAAGETGPAPPGTYAIALAARDEAHLLEVEARLVASGIPHKTIREPGAPFNGAATAIGIPPMERRPLRKLLSGLPLVK